MGECYEDSKDRTASKRSLLLPTAARWRVNPDHRQVGSRVRTVGKFEKGRVPRRKDPCSTITERHNAPRGNEQISKAEGEDPVPVHIPILQKLFREPIPGLPQDKTVANQMATDDRQ